MVGSCRVLAVWSVIASLAGCGDGGGGKPTDAAVGGDAVDAPTSNLERIDCEVVIVGGGAGGIHTAFRLAPTLGARVCLFEKEAELGGRIKDVPKDSSPNAPRFGVGALRVMEGQTVLFDLAAELAITLESPPSTRDLVNARGGWALSKEPLVPRYPGLEADPGGDTETALYEEMLFGTTGQMAALYPDFRSFLRGAFGAPAFDFLRDMSRFRADFEYPLDARGYLDYLAEEWDVCCQPSYPVGGMSTFIFGMEGRAAAAGVRIFKSEPVVAIDRSGTGYRVVTEKHEAIAQKLVINVPPHAFPHIAGDVVAEIAAQPQFQDLIGVKVATVTQWWPSNWWSTIAEAGQPGNTIWRAWTTEHCLNYIEIPLNASAVAQHVTRSVYDDERSCVEFWEQTAARGTAAVEAEIKRGLEHLFIGNGVTEPATFAIPAPTKTHVQIWPAGWYWLRAGSPYTNQDIYDWAVEPLAGESVALVGEAYHPRRSGWSDAAYKSSIHLLNRKYGLNLKVRPTPKRPRSAPFTRSLGGN